MSAPRSRGRPDPRVAGRASGKPRGDFDGRPSRERRLLRALGNVARTLPAAPSRGLIADREPVRRFHAHRGPRRIPFSRYIRQSRPHRPAERGSSPLGSPPMTSSDRATPTRRGLLGGAAVAGAAAPIALAAPASAATRYTPVRYRGAPLLSRADRHLVSRFSYGVTPALAKEVRAAGGARKWFEKQLTPGAVKEGGVTGLRGWWGPGLSYVGNAGAASLWDRQKREIEGGWEVMASYQRWALVRRIRSRRQVLETMSEFWENHFNVPVNGDAAFTWRTDYGMKLRAAALDVVRRPAADRDPPPSDGHLPEQRRQHQVGAEREPRSRAARAPHRRPDRGLHRGRRQELRPDPHRLPGRHVAGLLGDLQAPGPLDRPGDGDGLVTTTTPTRTGSRSRRSTSTSWPTTPRPPAGSRASCA